MTKTLIAATFALFPGISFACEGQLVLTTPQAEERIAVLRDQTTSTLDKLVAFEELHCSTSAGHRAIAVEEGIATGERALISQILFDAIFSRETLVLRPYDNGTLTESQAALVASAQSFYFEFEYLFPEDSCISIYQSYEDGCRSNAMLDIRTDSIAITYDDQIAELWLEPDGLLRGYYSSHAVESIPVEATIF